MKITWHEKACCHSGKCVQALPSVFKVENGKFVIDHERAKEEEIRDRKSVV